MRILLATSALVFSMLAAVSIATPASADSSIEEMRSTDAPSTAPAVDQTDINAAQQHTGRVQHEHKVIQR